MSRVVKTIFIAIVLIGLTFTFKRFIKLGLNPLAFFLQDIGQYTYLFLTSTRKEEALRTEIIKLQKQLVKLREAESENILLRKQLAIEPKKTFKLQLTSVIGFNEALFVDQPTATGLPVIAAGNILVGTTGANGLINLITDPDSEVAGFIYEAQTQGLVKGHFGTSLYMDTPLSENNIFKEQIVTTSGLHGVFPPGLIIGKITNVSQKENKTFQRILIAPGFRIKALSKVFVVVDF